MYPFLGTSKDVSLGPTAILSLLTLTLIDGCGSPDDKESRAPCAVALTLFSGLVQLVCAVLNFGEGSTQHTHTHTYVHTHTHTFWGGC